jgi:hypothetical protein
MSSKNSFMKSFPNLPKSVLQSLINLEKKIVMYPVEEKFKRFKQQMEDEKENRELIVVDKYGNRYYQYYSRHGLPTRRIVHLNMTSFNKWTDDPVMSGWLSQRRQIPLTQEELEKIYIEQEEFARRGLEWDRKEQAILEEYRNKRKNAIEEERKETKAIGEGPDYSPGVWERTQLVEIKEEPKEVLEGMSNIPGKYMADFREEDLAWIKRREIKMNSHLIKLAEQVDWSKYSIEKMSERFHEEQHVNKQSHAAKQQELTNFGKKMLEKKQQFQNYKNFKQRFSDIFETNDHL